MEKNGEAKKEKADLYLKKLQKQLMYYRQSVIDSSDAVIIQDFDGVIKAWNKGAEKIYGFKSKEILGKNIRKIIAKKERASAIKNIKAIRAGKPTFVIKQTRITKDKKELLINITYSPIFETNEIVEIATSGQDISQLNEVLNELKIYSERYNKFFDNMSESAVIYEIINNGKNIIIKNINKAALKLEKVNKKDVIDKKVDKVFPGIKKFGLYDLIKKVYRTGKAINFLNSFYYDKHNSGWRDNTIFKLSDKTVATIYSDITQKKKNQTKLIESEEKYRGLFDNAVDAIFIAEIDTKKFLDCNKAAENLLGYSRNKILTMSVKDIHPKDLLKDAMDGYKKHINGHLLQIDTEVLTKNKKKNSSFHQCIDCSY